MPRAIAAPGTRGRLPRASLTKRSISDAGCELDELRPTSSAISLLAGLAIPDRREEPQLALPPVLISRGEGGRYLVRRRRYPFLVLVVAFVATRVTAAAVGAAIVRTAGITFRTADR
jgi:hypothetical protein